MADSSDDDDDDYDDDDDNDDDDDDDGLPEIEWEERFGANAIAE